MLSMSDVNIEDFIPFFANTGISVAFLVPTPTGFDKSIMDATSPVRELFLREGIHDYEHQLQGPENKVLVKTYLVGSNELVETETSLYRPVTKKGDPRIWIYKLKQYCVPGNLLALVIIDKELYVFNLSNVLISESLKDGGYCHDILEEASHKENIIADELLSKLRKIHALGFIPTITIGDPGVGDTLENALGISRNNRRTPDYKGIELKATRLTRRGTVRQQTRSTLFTKVPDKGMTYKQIVDNYGKVQTPRGRTESRLQLYETFRCSRPNAYDLMLEVNYVDDELKMMHQEEMIRKYVSAWYMDGLKNTLLVKHRETFWVKAQSEEINGIEHFRYDTVLHTRKPNASLLAPLLETDKITLDLAAHYEKDGRWRDHGMLFKMKPSDLPLLLGEPKEYIL